MNFFWDKGALFIKELRDFYPEPKPHPNTLSTMVRLLESEHFVGHKSYGTTYQYFPLVSRDAYKKGRLSYLIDTYFGHSYLNMVSSLVQDEKISVEELRQFVDQVAEQEGPQKEPQKEPLKEPQGEPLKEPLKEPQKESQKEPHKATTDPNLNPETDYCPSK